MTCHYIELLVSFVTGLEKGPPPILVLAATLTLYSVNTSKPFNKTDVLLSVNVTYSGEEEEEEE